MRGDRSRGIVHLHPEQEENVGMTPDQLEILSNMLTEVAHTLAVIALAQRLSEATSEEERIFLSQALSGLISNIYGSQRISASPQGQPYRQGMF